MIIYGRSDAVLNPGGVRIGTAEIYRQVEQLDEVVESLVIGQQWEDDERIVLFVRLRDGVDARRRRSRTHPPAHPRRTRRRATCRRGSCRSPTSRARRAARSSSWPCATSSTAATVKNREALANPEALEQFAIGRSCDVSSGLTSDSITIRMQWITLSFSPPAGRRSDRSAARSRISPPPISAPSSFARRSRAPASTRTTSATSSWAACCRPAPGMNVARQAALKAGVPVEVPAETDQPRLRLRAAGGRARGRGGQGRLRRSDRSPAAPSR